MNEYINAIAAREGISPQEVYSEIQKAIELAWDNPDKKTRRAQLGLTSKLKAPGPEELMAAIIDRALKEIK